MAIIMDEKKWLESKRNQIYGITVKKIEREDEITLEMLEEGLQTSALIVKRYGRKYLPIFERMHREVEHWKTEQSMLAKALEIADSNLIDR